MRKERKAQLSLIIIIGIVLLILTATAILLTRPRTQQLTPLDPQRQLQQAVQSCLEQSIPPAFFALGLAPGPDSIEHNGTTYSVGVRGDTILLPTTDEFLHSAALAAARAASGCINITVPGWTITADDISATTTPTPTGTLTRLQWNVQAKNIDTTLAINDWSVDTPIDLAGTLQHARNVAQTLTQDRTTIPVGADADETRPLLTTTLNNSWIIIATQDRAAQLDNKPFAIVYAADRNAARYAPLDLPARITLHAGEPYTLDINTDDAGATYTDDTTLFDIDPTTGVISFTPHIPDDRIVTITATNDAGQSTATVTFEVLP